MTLADADLGGEGSNSRPAESAEELRRQGHMTGFTVRVDLLDADEAMVDQIQLDVREQDLETLALTGKEARDVSGLAIAKVRVVVSPHRR